MQISKPTLYLGHLGSIYTLEKSVTPGTFYSGGSDGILSYWPNPESPVALSRMQSPIYALRFNQKAGKIYAGTGSGQFYALDVVNKELLSAIQFHTSGIFDLQFTEKNQRLFSGSVQGELAVWDLKDFTLIKKSVLTKGKIRGMAISNDENSLAVACGDGSISIIDTTSLLETHSFPAHANSTNSVCFHPNLPILVSGGRDAHLRMWSLIDFTMLKEIPAHNYAIYSIAFSPDQKIMATASRDKTAKLWSAEDFSFLHRIDREQSDAHSHSVNKVLWLDNQNLLTAGDDRKILRFEISMVN